MSCVAVFRGALHDLAYFLSFKKIQRKARKHLWEALGGWPASLQPLWDPPRDSLRHPWEDPVADLWYYQKLLPLLSSDLCHGMLVPQLPKHLICVYVQVDRFDSRPACSWHAWHSNLHPCRKHSSSQVAGDQRCQPSLRGPLV